MLRSFAVASFFLLSICAANVPAVFEYPTCPAVFNATLPIHNFGSSPRFEQDQEQIHTKSLYIARVFAQLLVLIIAVNIVSLEFDEEFELHRAVEVRLVPLRNRPIQVSYERLDNQTASTSQQTEC